MLLTPQDPPGNWLNLVQGFGALGAYVLTVVVFLYYLRDRDKVIREVQEKSDAAHLATAKLCTDSQADGHEIMRECVKAIASASSREERVVRILERLEAKT